MDCKERSLQATVVAGLVMVAVAVVLLIGCSSSDSNPADFELTTALDLDQIDPEILQLADAAVERFGDEGGFSAVMLALERGYSVDQLLAAPDALNEDGTVDGVAPAGPRAGQFDLEESQTPPSPEQASPAATAPATAATPTLVPATPEAPLVPARIVSLSPMITELIFELGRGDLIVAATPSPANPDQAPELAVFGTVESLDQITAQDPDLVIIELRDPDLFDELRRAGIETLAVGTPASIDEGVELVTELGQLLDASDEADDLNSQIRADLGFGVSELPVGPLRIYHEYYVPGQVHPSASSDSFIGTIYANAGYINIADEFDVGLGVGFLTDADIVRANPDIIVIEGLPRDVSFSISGDRPTWASTSAMSTGAVILFDAQQPSRFGPRAGIFVGGVASQAVLAIPGGS